MHCQSRLHPDTLQMFLEPHTTEHRPFLQGNGLSAYCPHTAIVYPGHRGGRRTSLKFFSKLSSTPALASEIFITFVTVRQEITNTDKSSSTKLHWLYHLELVRVPEHKILLNYLFLALYAVLNYQSRSIRSIYFRSRLKKDGFLLHT